MTIDDWALGISAWAAAHNVPCVKGLFDMQCVSSAQIGEFVEILPQVMRGTRSLVFMRGDLVVGERLVAPASGIWKILCSR